MGLSQMTSVFGAAAHGFDPYNWRSAGMNGKLLWWTSAWDAAVKVALSLALSLSLSLSLSVCLCLYVSE